MFEKFKDLAKLKQMQDAMKQETVTAEYNGVAITMNGNFEVQAVRLNPTLGIDGQQQAVVEAFNKAKDQLQKNLAKNVMGMMQ